MSTRKNKVHFRCDDDCKMSGCPGHYMVGILQDTSDFIDIKDEKGNEVYSGDISKTNSLLRLLKKLDYHETYFRENLKNYDI